ncbi:NAD(P) transhydrogenase subunit alpha [Lishizhenia tianjinensis]|uniref:proton-translocating NAD(P)(+) transhydrogenase n=1 Tax=Lishizhenia tianjinensis TaxID=477690 RepID=A0A1I6YCI4_9FLAO|nr:hypothetical protein [Lishizhenia tianjinensis]SFT48256.1 NAD(P) transhydrogenase subunit alpha [Lishizhenia tianjinensis]
MKSIALLKEKDDRNIVALSPANVKALAVNYTVMIESGAGLKAGFTDDEYAHHGGHIIENKEKLLANADILISYAAEIPVNSFTEANMVIGCYHVLDGLDDFSFYKKKLEFYSLDLLPRTTLAQSMDVLSSLASLAGYQAVIEGLNKVKKVAPMIAGAGGTLQPMHVLVLGVGVAGLQAIATAKRMGAVVSAFDVRKQTQLEVESLGAKFIEIEGAKEDQESGGYAIEQGEDFNQMVQDTIAKNCEHIDVIITTARIPGRKAPILINEAALKALKKDSIIIDLAASTGGNVIQQDISKHYALVSNSELFDQLAYSSSLLLGNNICNFLKHWEKQADKDEKDDILKGALVAKGGQIVHPRLIQN